jgi:hypothetical protein
MGEALSAGGSAFIQGSETRPLELMHFTLRAW